MLAAPARAKPSSTQAGRCWFWTAALYLGRSQDILLFEIGSLLWVLVAIGLLLRGTAAVKAMWFPLFFMLFMIPLPGVVVDTVTMPMKMAVSYVAENILCWVGYPIARTGVILQIGQYQLLVADACAGLHTLFTLEALGLLLSQPGASRIRGPQRYPRHPHRTHLIHRQCDPGNGAHPRTYHFGDEAGQGFLHGFAGMVLF